MPVKQYIVYDTKHKVYNLGQEAITGLGIRSWGSKRDQAEKLSQRSAKILAGVLNARTPYTTRGNPRYVVEDYNQPQGGSK